MEVQLRVGVIGIEKSFINKEKPKTIECYFEGDIKLLNNSYSIGVGGIIGYKIGGYYSNTEKCYTKGTITVNSDVEVDVGGIVGYAFQYTQIENCYNRMNISIDSIGTIYAGGICGKCGNKNNFLNCYNLGTISGATYSNEILAYSSAGYDTVRIENCYSAVNKNSENIDNEKILDWIKVDKNSMLEIVNSYTVINNKIYKYEYNIGAGESIQEVETGGVTEEYFYSREYIKDVLGWDLNIWNVTGASHPTLK